MSSHGTGFSSLLVSSVFTVLFSLAGAPSARAALDSFDPELVMPETGAPDTVELELTGDRWQRFLASSRDRYQALAEKAAWLERPLADDCVEPQLTLTERYDCLRSDVFARSALEASGMTVAEYAVVLHQTVTRPGSRGPNNQQRRQFQRLQAEWWPTLALTP